MDKLGNGVPDNATMVSVRAYADRVNHLTIDGSCADVEIVLSRVADNNVNQWVCTINDHVQVKVVLIVDADNLSAGIELKIGRAAQVMVEWRRRASVCLQKPIYLEFHAQLKESAELVAYNVEQLSVHDTITYSVVLQGSHASAVITDVAVMADHEQRAVHVRMVHEAAYTVSGTLVSVVATQGSRATLDALMIIENRAHRSRAQQELRGLLVGERARITAQPIVHAHTNDITCSHACSISGFDKEQLWYNATKGIGHATAAKLLIQGFLMATLLKSKKGIHAFDDASIIAYCVEQLLRKNIDI